MNKKLKICVYAIAKNEEEKLQEWIDSMKEADKIVVLDTGSTDKTIEILKKNKISYKVEKISPWRFDVARNKSMELVPKTYDICVCTDIDERFEKGWRNELEKLWTDGVKQIKYKYTWYRDEKGNESVFYIEKIHARNGFSWVHPVHEVIQYVGKGKYKSVLTDKIHLVHYQDITKKRSQYLPLLELSVKENPFDDRNMHYLGREYMYYEMWDKSIETLKRHLFLPTATWPDERCASMRFIGRCYNRKNNYYEAEKWFLKALAEAPHLREPYMELVKLYYQKESWYGLIHMVESALRIITPPTTYINELQSWDSTPYDYASIAYYALKDKTNALKNIDLAISKSPDDERLQKNKEIILSL